MNAITKEFKTPKWGLNKWRKNGRKPLNPEQTVVQFFEFRPMKLRNYVAGKGTGIKETPCVPEVLKLLECLKNHDFMQSRCSEEVDSLTSCHSSARAKSASLKAMKDQSVPIPYEKDLSASQLNSMLSRFPQKLPGK